MTNSTLSILSSATAVRPRERAEVVPRPRFQAAHLPSQPEMLRIANRLTLSLRAGEQIVACCGVRANDPSGSFALHAAAAMVRLGRGPVLFVRAALSTANSSHEPGLLNVLARETDLDEALERSDLEDLFVLEAGALPIFQPSLLSSSAMGSTVARLRRFSLVLMDVGPVTESAESMILASHADAMVAVATSGERTRREIKKLHEETTMLKARFLGVVLTDVK